jgi:trans-aconitate methyltransferase
MVVHVTQSRLGELFDAAHAEFARWMPLLWVPMGEATVARADIGWGDRVLDVCCGAGASAIPAARAVGPQGHVDAIDLAPTLLNQARRTAIGQDLTQLEFSYADATTWTPPSGSYDIIQCAYGVFFFPDMDNDSRRLVTLLKPGGRFTVTTWDQHAIVAIGQALGPALAEQGHTMERLAPSVAAARIHTPELLRQWLGSLGLRDLAVTTVNLEIPLDGERAWSFVLGTGLRSLLDGLSEPQQTQLRDDFVTGLAEHRIDSLNATSHIGVGARP